MTLDSQIKQDLTELYYGGEVSAAKSLEGLIKVSIHGLPQHFVGNRNAQTVIVMLNPGQDVDGANRNFRCATINYCRKNAKTFIASYIEEKTNFGRIDKDREDHFDVKQAAFLKAWKESGIKLPSKFPDDKKTFLQAKEAVLMQKLQLELIPYCSSTFKLGKGSILPVFPFVETLLEEILAKKRTMVVFCAGIFERVFKAYNKKIGETIFEMEETKYGLKSLKPGGKLKGKCRIVTIRFNGKTQRALIAHTFASQALSKAYKTMERYGEFCAETFGVR